MKQFVVAIALGALLLPGLGRAQTPVRSAAAAQLRREYYAQDFSRVVQDGKAMLRKFPKDLELRAWYLAANALEGGSFFAAYAGKSDLDAVVGQMKLSAPDSPWTLLARAAAAGYQDELDTKIDLCGKAIAEAKDNPDVLVLATDVVREGARAASGSDRPPSAALLLKKFVGEHKGEYKRSPDGLAAEAQALDTIAQMEKNTKSTTTVKLVDRALKEDPRNVAALLLKSQALLEKQEYGAEYDLLRAAAQAVPDSYALHLAYWKAVLAAPNANPAEQKREILADAKRIISTVEPSTQIVRGSLSQLSNASPALESALGNLLLRQYPRSAVEDAVRFYRAMGKEAVTQDETDAQVVRLEAFLGRPRHYDDSLLSQANLYLVFDLNTQQDPDLGRLYQAELDSAGSFGGMPRSGVVVLADHKFHLPELERLAQTQLDAQWTRLQETVKRAPVPSLKPTVESWVEPTVADWLDALGWVELQEGRSDVALSDLEAASKLDPGDSGMAVHLGRVYVAKGDNAKAENTFLDAFAMPYYGESDHPAIAALRELYIHTHGGDKGLEAYMQPILAKDAARRHKAIIAARLHPEKPIPQFDLAMLSGKKVNSEGLRGKYLILNFWATW